MKTKFLILIPFIFIACKEIDIEKVVKEDNLSGEKKDYLIACEKYDNARSCNAIAAAYSRGEGAVENEDKALLYYEKACNLAIKLNPDEIQKIQSEIGFWPCSSAAGMYRAKVKKGFKDGSEDKVLELHKKDCLNGFDDYRSCLNVAKYYEKRQKYSQAREYYLRSCLKSEVCLGFGVCDVCRGGSNYLEILYK